jgi:metallo-beta-lactamase family protein
VPLFSPLPYEQTFSVAPGVSVRMFEAGHILGSASIEMTLEDSGVKRVVVFSGDLGPRDSPILHDYTRLERGGVVFLESTYGDRDHRPLKETVDEFRQIISEAVSQRGKILVPSFAVGRSQTILYHLAEMFEEKIVPPFPVVLDSPMAIEATDLHRRHPELYDAEMKAAAGEHTFLRNFPHLQHSVTAEESRALNDLAGPCLILAGAGMCNAGRIMHHLRHNLGNEATVVLIVGYQAPGSLGRSLIDGAKEVSLFGEPLPVRAKVHSLGGFSAHAAQSDLLYWLASLAPRSPRVVLTHGEDRGRLPLAGVIQQRFHLKPILPELFDVIDV